MAPQATATSFLQGKRNCSRIRFSTCALRASYTLGGAGAAIVYDEEGF